MARSYTTILYVVDHLQTRVSYFKFSIITSAKERDYVITGVYLSVRLNPKWLNVVKGSYINFQNILIIEQMITFWSC